MPAELPIACSLSATELPTRLSEMAGLGRDALLDARTERTHARLRFAARDNVRERVEAIVAAESRCCAFLTMTVAGEPGAVVLDIDAREDAAPVVAKLVDAFASGAGGRPDGRGHQTPIRSPSAAGS